MRKKKLALPEVLPCHVAIFLDGNGRWGKRRGLPRAAGHAAGSENFRRISTFCRDVGIKYLTVYAFSTENWKRSTEEVGALMGLFRRYLREAIDRVDINRTRIRVMGDLGPMPDDIKELVAQAEELSSKYEGCSLQICLNYGARDEIVRAVKKLGGRCDITEELISGALDSSGIPDPDICIRPGGESRLSNFLLWQFAYTELFFLDKLWPDFSEKDFVEILWEFSKRERRYGSASRR